MLGYLCKGICCSRSNCVEQCDAHDFDVTYKIGSAGISSVRKAGCTVLCNIMLLSRDRHRSIHHEVYRFCLGHSSGELQLNS